MPEPDFKVVVLGCCGIGRLISTVVRRAVYLIQQDRPDQVIVVSSGSLAGGMSESVAIAGKYPLLVIDGCRPRCATALCLGRGLSVAASLYAADTIAKRKLTLVGEKREALGEKGMAVARALADEAIDRIDWLLADEMVSRL